MELKARLPNNIVPKTDVQRVLTINGNRPRHTHTHTLTHRDFTVPPCPR